jgi:hypothetical protein
MLGRSDHGADVLVGAGCFLGDSAQRRRSDENAGCREIIDDLAAAPSLERCVAGERPAGAMTRRGERFRFARRFADENVGTRPHAAADENRLADRKQVRGQAFVTGPKGSRRAFAVNEQFPPLSVDDMRFHLAGIVRNIEQEAQIAVREEVRQDAAGVMAKDFAVCQRAI